MMESKLKRFKRLHAELKSDRHSWVEHWKEISEHFNSRREPFLGGTQTKGSRKNDKLINNTPSLALRTLASGMMAGITSPSRPWFRLNTIDPKLAEIQGVRIWLDNVEERLRQSFISSNIYNALAQMYADLGRYGTAVMIVDEDSTDVIRAYVQSVGQYVLMDDERQKVDGCIIEIALKVEEAVRLFGRDKVSKNVREKYDSGRSGTVDVVRVIARNRERDSEKADYRGKKYSSCWYEASTGEQGETFLRESGYDDLPVIAPRWSVSPGDVYGTGPGMEALGDVKGLFLLEKRKMTLVDMLAKPPMIVPASMRLTNAAFFPGSTISADPSVGGAKIEPAIITNPNGVTVTREAFAEHKERIEATFMVDLWQMMSRSDRRTITAREVDERHEEKMLLLGPVLERLNDELLAPLIDRAFGVLEKKGLIPEPPQELQGQDLRIDYVSIAAQAQKLLGTTGIERLASFVGSLASVQPDVVDKLNTDELVDEYSSLLGTKADLVRSDEMVEEMRGSRAQAAQAQQQQQALATVSQGAKTLSETDMGGDSALNRMLGGLGQGGFA